MAKQKTPHDVLGFQKKCVNFIQCPLCYGCRNYNTVDPNCVECTTNRKINICNTDLHKSDVVTQFITKNKVVLPKDVTFENNNKTLEGDTNE